MPKKISKETYYCVKHLIAVGKRADEVCATAKVSNTTVSLIRNASSYDAYRAASKERAEKSKKRTAVNVRHYTAIPAQEVKETTKDMRELIMRKIDDLLGEVKIYRSTRQVGSEEARAATMAKLKLEEAEMWLERSLY